MAEVAQLIPWIDIEVSHSGVGRQRSQVAFFLARKRWRQAVRCRFPGHAAFAVVRPVGGVQTGSFVTGTSAPWKHTRLWMPSLAAGQKGISVEHKCERYMGTFACTEAGPGSMLTNLGGEVDTLSSTATGSTASSRWIKVASSNTGGQASSLSC